MKPLPSHFPKKQHLQISDLSDKSSLNKSMVARAAMQIGLKVLRENEDLEKAILIGDALSRN